MNPRLPSRQPGFASMPPMRFVILVLFLVRSGEVRAAEPVRYQRDIRPILSNNCFKCHGPDLKKGNLDLQSFESATKKLPSGATPIVAGKPEASALIKRVSAHDVSERMPPKEEALKPEQ